VAHTGLCCIFQVFLSVQSHRLGHIAESHRACVGMACRCNAAAAVESAHAGFFLVLAMHDCTLAFSSLPQA
jgi:hypothetical protein